MNDRIALIDKILVVMRSYWDLPADCNEGELFTYSEALLDRILAGDSKEALYSYLASVQCDKLEMPKSEAYKQIIDRSVDLVRNSS
jgi:hypothetical protein